MIPILKERFHGNIDRVRNLVSIHEQVAGGIQERTDVMKSDLLRAAVVFLHAALEDLLREIAAWTLPSAKPDVLSQIPYPHLDGDRSPKLTLGNLATHRGKTVDEVINLSVMAHLAKSSYNDTSDITRLLRQIGFDPTAIGRLMDAHGPLLKIAMLRRHQIAHQLDRNEAAEGGWHKALSIDRMAVDSWIESVVLFADGLFTEIEKLPIPLEAKP